MVNLHVNETTVGDRTVVSIEGVVDLSSLATLQDALARAIQRHHGGVVTADLDGVTAIDDCGLVELDGAGHYGHLDDFEAVLSATRHFLENG